MELNIKELLRQQVAINEQMFFLNLAIRLQMNYNTTQFQIRDIHSRILSGDKELDDYSGELQKLYGYYLSYLGLIV
jgi:cell division protein FtsL